MPDHTPIQEAVAWLLQEECRIATGFIAISGTKYTRWADAIEAQAAEVERLRRVELAAGNLDRYSLVIESAVRNEDFGNSDGVTNAILRLRDAMKRQAANG